MTKTAEKPYPLGPHIPIAHMGRTPSPPGGVYAGLLYKQWEFLILPTVFTFKLAITGKSFPPISHM